MILNEGILMASTWRMNGLRDTLWAADLGG